MGAVQYSVEPAPPPLLQPLFFRPLIPLLAAFILGIVAGDGWPGHRAVGWAMAAGSAGWVVAGVARGTGGLLSPLVLFGALGYLSIQFWAAPVLPPDPISGFVDGSRYGITGTLIEAPDRDPRRTRLVLQVASVRKKGVEQPASGRLRVSVYGSPPSLSRGDTIRFSSSIRPIRNFHNPGGFDYRRFMGFQRIHASAWVAAERLTKVGSAPVSGPQRRLGAWREAVARLIDAGCGDTDAGAVLHALILGDRTRISPDLRDAFNRTGIGHLLAISGLHIGIVATVAFAVFRWLLARFPFFLWRAWTRKGAAILALVPVVAYGLLAGMSPSTQRAVVMVAAFMAALVLESEPDPLNTLALAAWIVAVVFPPSVFSVSFQLSFTAVLAILYGLSVVPVPAFEPPGWLTTLARRAVAFLLVSALAIAGTLPLVMAYFHQVSLIGLAANCVFVPAVGFGVVPLGLIAAFVLPLSADAALWAVQAGAGLLEPLLAGARYLSRLPFAAVRTVSPSLLEIGCYYALGATALFWLGRRTTRAPAGGPDAWPRVRWVAVVAALVLAGDIGYWTYQRYGSGDLEVTLIDVGQGTSALIEFPGGRVFLVDGGGFPDNSAFDIGAAVIAPLLRQRKIQSVDTVVLTHPNSDHLNGLLSVLSQFNVRTVWSNGEPADTYGYRRFVGIVRERKIAMPGFTRLPRSTSVNGATVTILHPPADFLERPTADGGRDLNDNSLVIRVGYGDVSFLFTGDITAPAEAELVRTAGDSLASTVLVAPHHGSRTSSTAGFLDRVAPDIVAVSAGWRNRYRFPHPQVLDRYRANSCRVYRTDRHGALRFVTDGKTLTVRTVLESTENSTALSGGGGPG